MASFWGSINGNIIGTLYFISFQAAGVLLSCSIFRRKDAATRFLCGSVLGSVLLQWVPALFAFFFGFSKTAHILALLSCGVAAALAMLKVSRGGHPFHGLAGTRAFLKRHSAFLALFLVTFLLFCRMLSTHTIPLKADGLHTGQCAYGDMNMHLGFITSIAGQQAFPPSYSISPGDKLCYPFLCDSISSSVYIWGTSLRYAYMLPMFFAFAQVMLGFYCVAFSWLKKAAKAALAWFLFFYNGGLGFVYFIDWAEQRAYRFSDIFTGYYKTPTNLVGNNIRWVNVIVDMLLPQRATLFGYALLFPCIWLLWRAVYQGEKDLFLPAAVLAGAMPMAHTHSFLAMGLISAAWLLMYLCRELSRAGDALKDPLLKAAFRLKHPGKLFFPCFLLFMCLLQALSLAIQPSAILFMAICLAALGILFCFGLLCLTRYLRFYGARDLFSSWGAYLAVVLALALPQLFYWTFGQATGSGFVTGHFNWANLGDQYLWFYFKNWGVVLLLFIPAVLYGSRRSFSILSGGLLVWFVAEFISFSPNTYDNNKLLYVAYLFICCASADYGYRLYQKAREIKGASLYRNAFLCLSCASALLSIGRELVSDYTLYSSAHVKAAEFICQNTPADATFLTDERHNNEVSSLTGRNIVSGSGVFLGPHGIYDSVRAQDVKAMFESPETSGALFERYGVDYIMVSSYERSNYTLREEAFEDLFERVYEGDGGEIRLYRVSA